METRAANTGDVQSSLSFFYNCHFQMTTSSSHVEKVYFLNLLNIFVKVKRRRERENNNLARTIISLRLENNRASR